MKFESSSTSIVLLGKFRPDDFTLDKLAKGKVITGKIAESASYLTLIPGHHVQFTFAWGELLVLNERFQIVTTEPPYIRICDFVLNALGDFAPASTVAAFGINREGHYDLGSVEARNKLGVRLAPPEAWGAWGQTLQQDLSPKEKPNSLRSGLLLVQMRKPFLEEGLVGYLDVSVAPSTVVPNSTGVIFRSNHHHQIAENAKETKEVIKPSSVSDISSRLLASLSARFDNSIAQAESIFQETINP
jgi:hypothetical protein